MENNGIYKALAAINKKVVAVDKSRKNQQQGFAFRGIDDVMNSLHNTFAENEVIILPSCEQSEVESSVNARGTVIFRTKLLCRFTFVHSDGSSVTASAIGEAMDSGDKGHNKAMSIALKYVLLQMFLIPTEEQKDPDYNSHELLAESVDELMMLIEVVNRSSSIEELKDKWENNPEYHNLKAFKDAVNAKKLELNPTIK